MESNSNGRLPSFDIGFGHIAPPMPLEQSLLLTSDQERLHGEWSPQWASQNGRHNFPDREPQSNYGNPAHPSPYRLRQLEATPIPQNRQAPAYADHHHLRQPETNLGHTNTYASVPSMAYQNFNDHYHHHHHHHQGGYGPIVPIAPQPGLQQPNAQRAPLLPQGQSNFANAVGPSSQPAAWGFAPNAPVPPIETAIRQRASGACRRCRQTRSRCELIRSLNKCRTCVELGPEAERMCEYPRRGEPDVDRQVRRRPRQQHQQPQQQPQHQPQHQQPQHQQPQHQQPQHQQPQHQQPQHQQPQHQQPQHQQPQHQQLQHQQPQIQSYTPHNPPSQEAAVVHSAAIGLPPIELIQAGFKKFVYAYLQLGFLSKHEVRTSPVHDNDKFLLATVLSLSIRYTPSLIEHYGGRTVASTYFTAMARELAQKQTYEVSPTRAQAFLLMAIADWENGEPFRSSMNLAVAQDMAIQMNLHQEETYDAQYGGDMSLFINLESARRVFWMIYIHKNLYIECGAPRPFIDDDITVLLPCTETSFSFGGYDLTDTRLCLMQQGEMTTSGTRSLFATLIQVHHLWGRIARKASRKYHIGEFSRPWQANSEFQCMTNLLKDFEAHLPPRHVFNTLYLAAWGGEGLYIAYLSMTMLLRLGNIVLRKPFLSEMVEDFTNARNRDKNDKPKKDIIRFWGETAHQLFSNVKLLYGQIKALYQYREGIADEGFPQILLFCLYQCCSLSSYLSGHPELCETVAYPSATFPGAEQMTQHCFELIRNLSRRPLHREETGQIASPHIWRKFLEGLPAVPRNAEGAVEMNDSAKGLLEIEMDAFQKGYFSTA